MRLCSFILSLLLLSSCCSKPCDVQLLPSESFQMEVEGQKTDLYTLTNGSLTMQVTNFGARVVTLWAPDRNGAMADIVLGYPTLEQYVNNKGERFLGSVVGRVANRIGGGKFTLDGVEYTTPQNNNGQTLHGGLKGLDMVVWQVVDKSDNAIVLHSVAPDGQDGFPGNLDITMTYTLTPENEFKVEYLAKTDAPTVVNLSHHSFFNLKGEGTPFDFRTAHAIGDMIDCENEQLKNGRGYDMNWVLSRADDGAVVKVMSLYEPQSGRAMDVLTDQVALQFYSGNFFDSSTVGKYGRPRAFR